MTQIVYGHQTADYADIFVGNVPLRMVWNNYDHYPTTQDALTLLKLPDVLQRQVDFLTKLAPKTMVEFGIFEGGSSIMWPAILGSKYCGIDLRAGNPEIQHWVEKFGLKDRVSLNFGVSQADEKKVPEVIETFFGNEGVDLIIDDASHMYDLSRKTFETVFQFLSPGGVYLLEDWNWAHSRGDLFQKQKFWGEHPALTNLVFDLVMLVGTSTELIERIEISTGYTLIYKSATCSRSGPISFDAEIAKQGRVFNPI